MNVTNRINAKSKLNDNGRIVIPAEIRRKMGLSSGDTVVMTLQDGVLTLESQQARVRQVQESLRKLIPAGRNLSGDLIAHRREEARQEVEEWLG